MPTGGDDRDDDDIAHRQQIGVDDVQFCLPSLEPGRRNAHLAQTEFERDTGQDADEADGDHVGNVDLDHIAALS